MTAVTARAAGVGEVWVASPRPGPLTRAAAWIAGADALLAVGGAQAVAALAHGIDPAPRCDVIVGPGNAWVTAAKALVTGSVRIDGLAGPSELLVVVDGASDPDRAAADLLAQAEHDPDAVPGVIALDEAVIARIEDALERRLARLSTVETARASLAANGFALPARSAAEAADLCNRIAPEHLQILTADPDRIVPALRHYGGLFVGDGAAEVLGDYGAGPNHVLPTGGSARSTGGLSVFTFLKVSTWMRRAEDCGRDDLAAAARDAEALARHEGLAAHAEAARLRS
jgi:phosphoribosyl-ATP pyrophosphohydrolase/phosphoribosyl-AMP cyclohydrolase/histidinol dehydrogenase